MRYRIATREGWLDFTTVGAVTVATSSPDGATLTLAQLAGLEEWIVGRLQFLAPCERCGGRSSRDVCERCGDRGWCLP